MRKTASFNFKGVFVLSLLLASIALLSCGDGGTGPSVPDLTASTLTIEFTGDSSKIVVDFRPCVLQESLSFSGNKASDGSKGICEVTASWTICPDGSFDSYTLYRSETPGISSSPSSAELLGVFTDPNTIMYIDNDVDWATKYHYALRTSDDDYNNSVWSNEDSLTTPDRVFTFPEGMEFVSIPSGTFEMGSPESDPDSGDIERPVHTVTFNYSFEMMTTEVTQGMWEEVMGNNPSFFTGDLNRPVEKVSWEDCQEFVDAMIVLDPDYEYRLPTESEWEYACRAGTTTRYYWGDDPGHTLIDQYAWYYDNSEVTTHSVAQKLPNAWGLFDMNGNVLEWCEDWYHDSYSGAPDDGSAWLSPAGYYRVLRGGSWDYQARYCRSTERYNCSPDDRSFNHGFRLVRSVR